MIVPYGVPPCSTSRSGAWSICADEMVPFRTLILDAVEDGGCVAEEPASCDMVVVVAEDTV